MPRENSNQQSRTGRLRVLMLLSNAFNPDPRVHREANELVRAGHRVTILAWDRERKAPRSETIDGIRVERVYVGSTHGRGATQILFLSRFWLKAMALARSLRFDVVHAHDFDTLPLGYGLAKLKRAKLVYDAHESYADMLHTLPMFVRRGIVIAENVLMRRTDLVITVGEILREHLERRGARNVCVVGNWQDPAQFSFPETVLEQERKRLGIANGQKTIAFIANLGRERHVPELIEAVGQSPDVFLILGGEGPCAELARESAQRHANITYLGFVQPERVPLYTAISDIVYYGFDLQNPNARFSAPNKLFECLAAGRAMLVGDFGEIGRIVRELECGVILSDYSTDRIRSAIARMDRETLARYNRNSRVAGQDVYCWKRAGETLRTRYESM